MYDISTTWWGGVDTGPAGTAVCAQQAPPPEGSGSTQPRSPTRLLLAVSRSPWHPGKRVRTWPCCSAPSSQSPHLHRGCTACVNTLLSRSRAAQATAFPFQCCSSADVLKQRGQPRAPRSTSWPCPLKQLARERQQAGRAVKVGSNHRARLILVLILGWAGARHIGFDAEHQALLVSL